MIVLLGPCKGQSLLIDCGSTIPVGMYNADQDYSGGLISNTVNNGTDIYKTLRYGLQFQYNITVPPGKYIIHLIFSEPTVTGPGLRLFTYSINGVVSQPIDVFSLATIDHIGLTLVEHVDTQALSNINIIFTSILGNAIISAIRVIYVFPGLDEYCNGAPPLPTTLINDWYCMGSKRYSLIVVPPPPDVIPPPPPTM